MVDLKVENIEEGVKFTLLLDKDSLKGLFLFYSSSALSLSIELV